MFKIAFIAVAIVFASPAIVSAQDIFWSFSPTTLECTSVEFLSGPRSVYIFSDGEFGFDALDLDFSVSSSSAISFTGGETFNNFFTVIGGAAFDSSEVTIDAGGVSGNLFSVNIAQNGINPAITPLFDPHFEPGVGPNGAVLLARVDFELPLFSGVDTVDFEFALGRLGAFQLPSTVLNPSLGSATLELDHWPNSLGDVNMDDAVDFLDITPFIWVLSNSGYIRTADCNQDCVVDFFDIAPFIAILTDQ